MEVVPFGQPPDGRGPPSIKVDMEGSSVHHLLSINCDLQGEPDVQEFYNIALKSTFCLECLNNFSTERDKQQNLVLK